MKAIVYSLVISIFISTTAIAGNADTSAAALDSVMQAYIKRSAEIDSLLGTLKYKTGLITVGDVAQVNVPAGFKFLDGLDSRTVLWKLWKNPPDISVLGMLVPDSMDYFSDSSWAVTIEYVADGHVKDDDAQSINYDDLLKDIKEQNKTASDEREKQGYGRMDLIGWAQKPYYDQATHKLHWAKEYSTGDSLNTLNYNIRMLGRKGVLVMNVIAAMNCLPVVNEHLNTILASTEFTSGNRYQDFDDKIDKVAEYGIGGLVAGAVLAKTGLLAKIGLIIIKAWKAITLGIVGLFGFFRKKLFGKKSGPQAEG